jgi:nucleotide-binding universal stress UspA family protein
MDTGLPVFNIDPMENAISISLMPAKFAGWLLGVLGVLALVLFVGAEHDWTAVELGAWIAGAQGVPLRLAGPTEENRDASRLLASASLAIQRALGVAAEPMLLAPGPEELVRAASEAAIVVVGLSERWRKDGLGPVRSALARESPVPTVLVLRGLRPSGLAPPESRTRFTWSLAPGA